jgi:UDPglucose 6-dehydrogenase
VVIGSDSERAAEVMSQLYRPLYLIEKPILHTSLETAELTKYAANAFLAMKITFINEIADLCEQVGANVQDVAKGIGLDGRIGRKFLHAGPGYGGSCFTKDTTAMLRFGKRAGVPLRIVKATTEVNVAQRHRMVDKIERAVGTLRGKRIVLLGLSFKPNTDDTRDAPALTIAEGLLKRGAKVVAHDPVAMDAIAAAPLGRRIEFALNPYTAAEGAHALVLVTEWNQYRRLDLKRLARAMKKPVLLDLRNVYDPAYATEAGLSYVGVGRSAPRPARKGTAKAARDVARKRKEKAPAAKPRRTSAAKPSRKSQKKSARKPGRKAARRPAAKPARRPARRKR